ncbi:MAG: chromate resistance protein ChrB domain-containing protein [Thermoplasmata archaeon]|jgi:hypothetical protein
MRWITREKAMVDRIACPWLIKNFIDREAEFLFLPKEEVLRKVKELNAIPFDVEGAELTHYKENGEERVSFDAIIKKYNLTDPALNELAKIVRGADADIPNPPPESAGLKAIAKGFREISKDDYENMKLQFPVYDALYSYCKMKVGMNKKL